MELNLIATVNDSGYGTAGRGLLRGLSANGVRVALFDLPSSSDGSLGLDLDEVLLVRSALRAQREFDPAAPCVRVAPEHDMTLFAGHGLRAGLSFFETTELTPAERRHLGWLDRVLVPSSWARQVAIDNGIPADRVRVVPMGVDRATFRPAPMPEGGPTVFINVAKWERRKGQDVLLEAFERAFVPADQVRLRLLCGHPASTGKGDEWQERCAHSSLASLIEIVPRRRTAGEVAADMRAAHCGVFPARSEGWNFPLLEMLALGRPVITTGWGGPSEFVHAGNARLIEIDRLEPALDDRWITVYSEHKTGEWAHLGSSQVDQLVEHLRDIHALCQSGRLGPNTAGVITAEDLSWARSADRLVRSLR